MITDHMLNTLRYLRLSGRLTSIAVLLLLLQPYRACALTAAEQFIDNGGYIVNDGSGLLKYRDKELFIPASTFKILTCLTALEKLGSEYRYETQFFLDRHNNLYIKGFGDPFLTSEVILQIAKKLAELGVKGIDSLFLDESSFALNGETAAGENSTNPYDAPNGALSVNFNALPVHIGRDATVGSGEPQTPFIALMTEAGAGLSPGTYRINIGTLSQQRLLSPALRYTGELFIVQLKRAGINVQGGCHKKSVPNGLQPIYVHRGTMPLTEIVRNCLKFSNNFIANQLFLACGVKYFGLPATWEKSRRAVTGFAKDVLHLGPDQLKIEEGSGLSRQDRVSPAALLVILEHFRPYSDLLNRQGNTLLKSGTLKNVYCYVGYFAQGNELIPFAILLNQPKNRRDKVLEVLHAALRQQEKRAPAGG